MDIPGHPRFNPENDTYSFDLQPYMEDRVRQAMTRIQQAEESAYRDALIELGWTPPDTPVHREWLVEWLNVDGYMTSQLFYVESVAREKLEDHKADPLIGHCRISSRTVSAWRSA